MLFDHVEYIIKLAGRQFNHIIKLRLITSEYLTADQLTQTIISLPSDNIFKLASSFKCLAVKIKKGLTIYYY